MLTRPWYAIRIGTGSPRLKRPQALAASYSQYRPIKGDGQCGWRGKSGCLGMKINLKSFIAVVFGYFESLLHQDLAKVASEKARVRSFNDTLVTVGYEFSMVELFVDETMDLFDSVHQAITSGDRSDRLLLDVFNDENRSNSIVFHFKVCLPPLKHHTMISPDQYQLLTSATMKLNPDQYQPYLEQPVFDYCQSNVDAFGQEIEQISLQALTDGVIAPAQMSVVVMYLDRSEGHEVTSHYLVVNAAPDWPAITLLYRP
jgi:ubiquitin thioesterase protein OTUB1